MKKDPSTPVIVITTFGDKDTSVRAMESGAFDYIERNSMGTDVFEMLRRKIDWALRHRELQLRVGDLETLEQLRRGA